MLTEAAACLQCCHDGLPRCLLLHTPAPQPHAQLTPHCLPHSPEWMCSTAL